MGYWKLWLQPTSNIKCVTKSWLLCYELNPYNENCEHEKRGNTELHLTYWYIRVSICIVVLNLLLLVRYDDEIKVLLKLYKLFVICLTECYDTCTHRCPYSRRGKVWNDTILSIPRYSKYNNQTWSCYWNKCKAQTWSCYWNKCKAQTNHKNRTELLQAWFQVLHLHHLGHWLYTRVNSIC